MKPVAVAAPAKLNLALHVTGKRMDGYHLLESLVAFTEFGDALEIAPAEALTLSVTGPFSDDLHVAQEQNLVMQAAGMLRLRGGGSEGARLTLSKRIPVEAGLGGGSSDAAAALDALNHFWRLYEDEASLQKLAVKLGSDVPACLKRRPAWVTGAGEKVAPLAAFPETAVVLANPREPLPTAEVFKCFAGPFSAPQPMPKAFASIGDMVETLRRWKNDLEPAASSLMPGIRDLLAAVASTRGCLLARMSGSGPTCFGLYAALPEASQAAEELSRVYPGWWIMPTRLGAAHA